MCLYGDWPESSLKMKLLNPTDERIYAVSRVDGWWFDGIGPGETFTTDDNRAVVALLKHGCVPYEEEREQEKSKEDGNSGSKVEDEPLPPKKIIKRKVKVASIKKK